MRKISLTVLLLFTLGILFGANSKNGVTLIYLYNYTPEELTTIVNHKRSRVKLTKVELDSINVMVSSERYLYQELRKAIRESIIIDWDSKKVIKAADKNLIAMRKEMEEDIAYRIAQLLGPDKFRAFRLTLLDEYDRTLHSVAARRKKEFEAERKRELELKKEKK